MPKASHQVEKRLKQLTAFDSIRKLKILEMFQYNFAGFILVTILAYVQQVFIRENFRLFFEKT